MLPLDVTSDESVENAVSEVLRLDGRIGLLVNNAGFSLAPAGAEESSIEQAPIDLRYELLRGRSAGEASWCDCSYDNEHGESRLGEASWCRCCHRLQER